MNQKLTRSPTKVSAVSHGPSSYFTDFEELHWTLSLPTVSKVWTRNWPDHQQFSISFLESVQFSSSYFVQSVEGTLMPSLATIFIDSGSLPVKILPTLSKLNITCDNIHWHWLPSRKCSVKILSITLCPNYGQIPPALKVSASSYCFEQSVEETLTSRRKWSVRAALDQKKRE